MIRLAAASLAGELVAYRFKHILVRDAAYRATTKKLRATLHERYADWLEQRAGDRVGEYHEILGYHLEQAYRYRAELGDADATLATRAARHLGAGGERALQRARLPRLGEPGRASGRPHAAGEWRVPESPALLRIRDQPVRTGRRRPARSSRT